MGAEKLFYTAADYLEFIETSEEKYEYVNGDILAMAGGTANHSQISANVSFSLIKALMNRNCSVFNSDLKLQAANSYFFPDGMVICGDKQFAQDRTDIVINPTLVVEVLSDSTKGYDRGEKFWNYRQIESLKGYLLIASDQLHIDAYHKTEEGFWVLTDTTHLENDIYIPSLDITLPTKEVYNKIEFEGTKK